MKNLTLIIADKPINLNPHFSFNRTMQSDNLNNTTLLVKQIELFNTVIETHIEIQKKTIWNKDHLMATKMQIFELSKNNIFEAQKRLEEVFEKITQYREHNDILNLFEKQIERSQGHNRTLTLVATEFQNLEPDYIDFLGIYFEINKSVIERTAFIEELTNITLGKNPLTRLELNNQLMVRVIKNQINALNSYGRSLLNMQNNLINEKITKWNTKIDSFFGDNRRQIEDNDTKIEDLILEKIIVKEAKELGNIQATIWREQNSLLQQTIENVMKLESERLPERKVLVKKINVIIDNKEDKAEKLLTATIFSQIDGDIITLPKYD